jgi:nitrogenase molybdenum-iron protein beta chain
MPGSNVQEKEVVFGGAERLEEVLTNALDVMQGDLFVVLTSCVTEVIGDDVAAVIRPLQDQGVSIIFAETGGFKGNSYYGYDQVLQSLLKNYVVPGQAKVRRRVNLWGIMPSIDPFWRGNLEGIRELLQKLGLEVNSFFTDEDTLAGIRRAGSAELNIIVSEVYGQLAAQTCQEIHGIPFLTAPLPIGPSATDEFLRNIAQALSLDQEAVEKLITRENEKYYRIIDPLADCYNDIDLQRYVAIVGDANYAVSLTRFLADDLGWLPEAVAITDILDENQEIKLAERLAVLQPGIRPTVIFATDSSDIRQQIKTHWFGREELAGKYNNPLSPAFVIGSSFDRELAKDLGAAHLSVSFPVANRAVLDRSYSGYRGGLRLIEDLISTIIAGR